MTKIKRPILLKLVLRITVPLLIIYGFILYFSYQKNKENSLNKTKEYLVEMTNHNAQKLDKEFRQLSQTSKAIKNFVESAYPVSEEELFNFIATEVKNDPDNIGSGVAFYPYKFDSRREFFAVFIHKNQGTIRSSNLIDSYDYLNEDWFLIPVNLQDEYWTEPFWGRVSSALLMLNANPIYLDNELVGISFADMTLSILSQFSESNSIMNGYAYIISKQGTFIYHPRQDYVMKETIFSLAEEKGRPDVRKLGQEMIAGKSGISEYADLETGENKMIVYTPIPSAGWTFAAVIPEKAILHTVKEMALKQLLIMLAGLLIILVIIIVVAGSFSKPIKDLALVASEIAEGNLDVQIKNLRGDDEIAELGIVFNKMVSDLKLYIHNLTDITKAKESVESEMRIARQIQESLLPRIFPPFPDRKEFDLYATNIPAKEVAGDFFDFFLVDKKTIAIIIADVSGKGISAGLFMAVTRTLMKIVCESSISPEKALTKANQILCQDNDSCMFTTLFLGYYDILSGELLYSNAGHEYPYILTDSGECKVLLTKQDIALGIDDNHIYQLGKTQLEKDEMMILYTDGVPEATNRNNELYGEEQFRKVLIANRDKSLKKILEAVTEALHDYQGDEQFDDITLLILKRDA